MQRFAGATEDALVGAEPEVAGIVSHNCAKEHVGQAIGAGPLAEAPVVEVEDSRALGGNPHSAGRVGAKAVDAREVRPALSRKPLELFARQPVKPPLPNCQADTPFRIFNNGADEIVIEARFAAVIAHLSRGRAPKQAAIVAAAPEVAPGVFMQRLDPESGRIGAQHRREPGAIPAVQPRRVPAQRLVRLSSKSTPTWTEVRPLVNCTKPPSW